MLRLGRPQHDAPGPAGRAARVPPPGCLRLLPAQGCLHVLRARQRQDQASDESSSAPTTWHRLIELRVMPAADTFLNGFRVVLSSISYASGISFKL